MTTSERVPSVVVKPVERPDAASRLARVAAIIAAARQRRLAAQRKDAA